MKSIKFNIENEQGDKLAASLDMPVDGKPKAYALFAHCFTCSKNFLAVGNISRALTLHKIAVLRFDFTGLGESEGDFSDTNFSSNVRDLITVADFLAKKYEAPRLLIGHSLGGAAVLLAASQVPGLKAVVTIAAPADPEHVKKNIFSGIDQIEQKGKAEIVIGGRPFTIKKQFLDDLEDRNMKKVIHALDTALLIMHSPQDAIVEIENAAKIYDAARHPKSFITLDGADHLLSDKKDSLYAGHMIASWAEKYLDLPEKQTLLSDKEVVVRTGEESYTTEIKAGKHLFLADEPESAGGNDLGPSPYHLLSSALGACTGITLRMYANRKKWPLKEIKVHLEHDKIHAEDCAHCEDKTKKIDQIVRVIELEGELDEKQRQRLLEIANKCPVHKTLHSDIHVKSSLKSN